MIHTETNDQGVAFIRLRRPPANAFDTDQARALQTALQSVLDDERTVAVVLASDLEHFGLGADIVAINSYDDAELSEFIRTLREAVDAMDGCRVPTIAAIDGAAVGGCLELALACDFRIATSRSTFALPEVKLGLLPGAGGTQRLTDIVGASRALDLMLTGRTISCDEAERIGLVRRADSQDALGAATELAELIGGMPQGAVAEIRRAVKLRRTEERAAAYAHEGVKILELLRSEESGLRIAAFVNRRRGRARDTSSGPPQ